MAEARKKYIADISASLTKMFMALKLKKGDTLSESFLLADTMKYLELKADPNGAVETKDKKTTYPAREAAKIPSSDLTSLMLKHGAQPYITSGTSAIVSAAKLGYWDVVLLYKEKLIAMKREEKHADMLGWALLHAAKHSSDKAYQVAEMLIDAGANVNYERKVYYMRVDEDGKKKLYGKSYEKMVPKYDDGDERYLKEVTINNDHDDKAVCLSTPLHLAMYNANLRMISLLVSHGAKYDGTGCSPVYVAELNKDSKALLAYYEAMNIYLNAQEKQASLTAVVQT